MSRKQLFAISGPQQVGKTALAMKLAGRLRADGINAGYISEPIRESQNFFAGKFNNNLALEVFALHLLHETRGQFHFDVMILDRCLVDFIAYSRLRALQNELQEELLFRLEMFCREHSRSYNHVYLLHSDKVVGKQDEFQSKDNIDPGIALTEVKKVLTEWRQPYTSCMSNEIEDRAYKDITFQQR